MGQMKAIYDQIARAMPGVCPHCERDIEPDHIDWEAIDRIIEQIVAITRLEVEGKARQVEEGNWLSRREGEPETSERAEKLEIIWNQRKGEKEQCEASGKGD